MRAIDHHKEDLLVVEGLCPEAEAEEEMYDAMHVGNGDICNGIALIRSRQTHVM